LDVHQARQAHLRLAFAARVTRSEPLLCFSDRSGVFGEFVYALSDCDGRYAVGLAEVTTYPAVEDLAADVPAAVDVSAQRARIIAHVRRRCPASIPSRSTRFCA